MRTIRIKFLGFTSKIMENGIRDLLCKKYTLIENEDPDYVIYWVYDYEHYKYNCIRILYTSECYTPDFNDCDYAIGFDRLIFGDRYCRIPLYDLFQYKELYQSLKNRKPYCLDDVKAKTGFCSFVVSNCFANDMRVKILDKISEYKTVDSGGRFRNNIGGAVKDKLKFQKSRKFSIACENCSYDGYCTEKLMEAFAAGTIPIYWGDPNVVKDFNPKSFINVHDFANLDEMLQRVIELDNDDALYLSVLNEPAINESVNITDIGDFLSGIFDQSLETARRRSCSQIALSYENARKRHKFFETIIYKYYNKITNHIVRLKTGTLLTSKQTK